MPKSCKDIDDAWATLEAAFGDTQTVLDHRLKKLRAMPGLTDTQVQSYPSHAAIWYLDFGASVEEIYGLGTRCPKLGLTCFNPVAISTIINKLPYNVVNLIYDSELWGQAQLEEILTIIRSRKSNAQRRALDMDTAAIFSFSPHFLCPTATRVRERRPSSEKKAELRLLSLGYFHT